MANTVTKKPKFKVYHRYDEARARAGVPTTPKDERGQSRGTFIISLFDPYDKFTTVEIQRINRENKEYLDTLDEDSGERQKFLFAQLYIHGWKDVLDGDGEPIEFSAENAYDLLVQDHWLFRQLDAFAVEVMNFQSDPRAKVEKEAKN